MSTAQKTPVRKGTPPKLVAVPKAPVMAKPAAPVATRPKVLVIDDSALMRKAFTKVLAGEYAVTTAVDGLEAIEILKKDRSFQLIITDLLMPRLDGFAVIRAIRGSKSEALKTIPIIVVTGTADTNDVKLKALDLGATDFLTKPFTSADLLARSRSYTEHRNTVKALQKQAVRDPVTGLISKKLFDIQLEKDISRVIRHKEPLALMLVEISDARALFAELGEARSHSLLKMVSGMLGKAIRKEDTLARLGEGVFALSLPTAKPEGAAELARRILTALNGVRLKNKGQPVQVSAAIGVCAVEAGACPPSDTLYKTVKATLQEARARKTDRLFVKRIEVRKGKPAIDLPVGKVPTLKPAQPPVSIDKLLDSLERGERQQAARDLASALQRLKPLLGLLSQEQKAALLK